jgi:hypothetical protein
MWISAGIGTLLGGLAGFGVAGIFSAYVTKAGLIAGGGKILLAPQTLGIISMYTVAVPVGFGGMSIKRDEPWVKMTSFTDTEAEYLDKLLAMMHQACIETNKKDEANSLYRGYFVGRSMEFDPNDLDVAETSFATGRWWTLGGSAIILSNDFFERMDTNRGSYSTAFASQVETIFHETYHHYNRFNLDSPVNSTAPNYGFKMRTDIENTEAYKNFYQNVYLPYVQQ